MSENFTISVAVYQVQCRTSDMARISQDSSTDHFILDRKVQQEELMSLGGYLASTQDQMT